MSLYVPSVHCIIGCCVQETLKLEQKVLSDSRGTICPLAFVCDQLRDFYGDGLLLNVRNILSS
jgi:hypothetical protein